ncbi:MAG: pirin family protein [Polyangiaceae bacterium]
MSQDDTITFVRKLGFPWETEDPFLFCVYHDDKYPRGNAELGPDASLRGRTIGNDFVVKDGWRMYHGDRVPGFPQHPHRGFETVTVVRRGLVDHADSLGATARYGRGDTQWLTAGRGIVHAEMFPLVERERENPLELFQIWLNLPSTEKFAEPAFKMLWANDIPSRSFVDAEGKTAEIHVVAGALDDLTPPSPPPSSWAARPENEVAIWTLKLAAGARVTLPRARSSATKRTLYFFAGSRLTVAGREVDHPAAVGVKADRELELVAGPDEVEILLLQGKPIGQAVAQYGPFVMNTRAQIQQAFDDYQRTKFGGWPWPKDGPVHPPERGRFAQYADGHVEEAE